MFLHVFYYSVMNYHSENCALIARISSKLLTKQSTNSGSKCLPDSLLISSTLRSIVQAGLYGRADVNASNTSAMAIILPVNGISCAFNLWGNHYHPIFHGVLLQPFLPFPLTAMDLFHQEFYRQKQHVLSLLAIHLR